MKYRKIKIGVLLIFIICGCSKSEDATPEAPEISYNQTLYTTAFYKSGNSTQPSVDWKGDEGLFGLENSRPGVSINPETGIVSWDQTLLLGKSSIKILAYNNAGTSLATIELDNAMAGNFEGGFGRSKDGPQIGLKLSFGSDGSASLISYGFTTREADGNWTVLPGNKILGQYNYDDSSYYRLEGSLLYSESNPYLEGTLFSGNGIIEDMSVFRTDFLVK